MTTRNRKEPTALGVYIFAGGFSVGVRDHFKLLGHFEDGPFGADTSRKNLGIDVWENKAAWPVADFAGRVDFMYANPPCAPWSSNSSGRRVPWRHDPRVSCVHATFDLLGKIQPKVWALESVRPMFTKGRELVDSMAARAIDLGYEPTALMVNAAYHGVPQVRKRFFLVLSKVHLEWSTASHAEPITVKQALKQRLPKGPIYQMSKEMLDIAHEVGPGESFADLYTRRNARLVSAAKRHGKKVRGRPTWNMKRLDADRPAPVMISACVHPREHRHLTPNEQGVLCGFPPDYQFHPSICRASAEVAKGVTPPVGRYLASVVRSGIDARKPVRTPQYRLVEVLPDQIITKSLEINV